MDEITMRAQTVFIGVTLFLMGEAILKR